MRFTPLFDSAAEAAKYATGQALDYINVQSRDMRVKQFD